MRKQFAVLTSVQACHLCCFVQRYENEQSIIEKCDDMPQLTVIRSKTQVSANSGLPRASKRKKMEVRKLRGRGMTEYCDQKVLRRDCSFNTMYYVAHFFNRLASEIDPDDVG